MKCRVKIWFPVWERYETETEIEIPDDEDPETWLDEDTKLDLIEQEPFCDGDMAHALEYGHAGVTLIEEKADEDE